jgi:probable rRNA maturation factor
MAEATRPVPITLRYRAARVDRPRLRELLLRCLEREDAPDGCGIGLILAGSRLVHRLNREWLGRDRETDVLSFRYREPAGGAPEVLAPDAEARLLGEVVISVPRCFEQARERNVEAGVELARLLVHGALHVLGHDHGRPPERSRMQAGERRLRSWAARRGIGPGLLRGPRRKPG